MATAQVSTGLPQVLHEARHAIGWGYDRCYEPHCALAAGGQALVPSQLASHCGSRGALYTHYRLGGLGARQVRAMQGWVRQRHNRSCAPYALSPNQDLVRLRSVWPRTPSPPTDTGATCAA